MAGTKTFATQMVSQYLVALYLAQVRGSMFPEEIAEIVGADGRAAGAGRARDRPGRRGAARWPSGIADARDVLFIGRHTGYPAALEGALKLKEISYIHAEGFPAGELKHGPIALIEAGVPVVAVATECHVYPKMLSNIQEVQGPRRGGDRRRHRGRRRRSARWPTTSWRCPRTPELLSPVVVTVPLQLFAYHIAKLRGCDVDQPRNLAKSVTVE